MSYTYIFAVCGTIVVGNSPQFVSASIGDIDQYTVSVEFDKGVQSVDFTAGVTIDVDGAAATILSGTLAGDGVTVNYVLDAAVEIENTVTWEYSSATGMIESIYGGALLDVSAQAVENELGEQLYFDSPESSGHLVTIGL